MSGWIAAGALWYVLATVVAAVVAGRYDRWIDRAAWAGARGAVRRVVPTSLLVAAGVAGTEGFRLVRILPLAIGLGRAMCWPGWQAALVVTGFVLVDGLTAYIATGIPMICGDLVRETRARDEADDIATGRMVRVAGWSDADMSDSGGT